MRSVFCCLLLIVSCLICHGYEGQRANSVLLSGDWEWVIGDGTEPAETSGAQPGLTWKTATFPGQIVEYSKENAANIMYIWARKSFTVTAEQAGSLAVLHWNHINYGAAAYINGVKVGENVTTGPYQVILPAGTLKAGANRIVLRIAGAAGAPKSKSGFFLIPAGFADQYKTGMPLVGDDIWMDFADSAYIRTAQAIPDMTKSLVRIRVNQIGPGVFDDVKTLVSVKSWPDGAFVGKGEAPAQVATRTTYPLTSSTVVEVPMPSFKPWTYESPNLYTAEISLVRAGKTLDTVSYRFGMRDIRVENGNFRLNGKDLWLRGSELVGDWLWARPVIGKEKDYLVTEAREMSMNCFRTHSLPLPSKWADICDENGTMILAEFPVLFNLTDFQFTPEEKAIWHKNVLADSAAWMERLWNHPSVITWVLSNESIKDDEWEQGPYYDFVKSLDPTRPAMRTAATTKEVTDVHTCSNIYQPEEGVTNREAMDMANITDTASTNTEYMNAFEYPITQWTGTEDKAADALVYAQLGMEHTEAFRRARADVILPYMYAGWTKLRTGLEWKPGFARPISASLHSSLSPVLASLDMFDANYRTGQQVKSDLYLINDSWHEAKIHVDLLITREDPEYIPEAACLQTPVAKWSYDYDLPADSMKTVPVEWRLPATPGSYWLTARTTGMAGRPVLSQRFVRAIPTPTPPRELTSRKIVLIGGDEAARAFLTSNGLTIATSLEHLNPKTNVVLVWDPTKLTSVDIVITSEICDFAAAGGRVVVLTLGDWTWRSLCDITVTENRSTHASRVFPYADTGSPLTMGIPVQSLMRWNGLPGTVSKGTLSGPAMAGATKLLWGCTPDRTVVAEAPAAQKTGKIIFSTLEIREHIDPHQPNYDPAAVWVLFDMLTCPSPIAVGGVPAR